MAALLAIVAVLRLLVIGAKTFSYFDPASLTAALPDRFGRALTRATKSLAAGDQANQQRARKDAAWVLDHYRRITDLLASRSVSHSDAPVRVAQQLLALGIDYGRAKNRISTSSSWWAPAVHYPNWLIADATAVGVALATSTGIAGREASDLNWVERRSAADIGQLLTLAAPDNFNAVTRLVDRAGAHVRELSARFQTTEALIFEDALVSSIRSWTYPESGTDDGATDDDVSPTEVGWDRVITAQRSVLLLTDTWLGLVDAARRTRNQDIGAQADLAIKTAGAHRALDLARPVRQRIEGLREPMRVEEKADGRRVTPDWWVRHEVARELLIHFLDARTAILERVPSRTLQSVQEAQDRGQWRVAAMIGLASLELEDKIRTDLAVINDVVSRLETLRSQAVDDHRWPAPAQIAVEPDPELRPILLRRLAACMPHLGAHPHDPTQPDLYGQIHTFLFEAAFQAILGGNREVAGLLFGALFDQMGPTVGRLSSDLTGQTPTAKIIYGQAPVMAMMELSGYAILIDELDGNGILSTVAQTWDNLRLIRGPALFTALTQLADLVDSTFALTDVDLARQRRHQQLAQLLIDRGTTRTDIWSDTPPPADQSPIVAAYAEGGIGSTWELTDLFLVRYIAARLGDDSLLPPRAKALADTLAAYSVDDDAPDNTGQASATADKDGEGDNA